MSANTKNPLTPATSLLCKLASIAVHADEIFSPDGHLFDKAALRANLSDEEVKEWIGKMTRAGLAPRKRNASEAPAVHIPKGLKV